MLVIVNNKITGIFKIDDGIKINAENYCIFLDFFHFVIQVKEEKKIKNL